LAENFFGAVVEIADRVERLDQRVLINTVIKNFPHLQKALIELNTEGRKTSQLFELNVNADGVRLNTISRNYSPITIERALAAGNPKRSPQDINLNKTGEYYKSKRISFDSLAADYFNMLSNPIKDDGTNLESVWGGAAGLDGLIESNWDIFTEEATPFFQDALINIIAA